MLGLCLKDKREEKRLTQEELAAKSGVTRQTICSIETDVNYNPTFNTLMKLSEALDCTIEELFFSSDRSIN